MCGLFLFLLWVLLLIRGFLPQHHLERRLLLEIIISWLRKKKIEPLLWCWQKGREWCDELSRGCFYIFISKLYVFGTFIWTCSCTLFWIMAWTCVLLWIILYMILSLLARYVSLLVVGFDFHFVRYTYPFFLYGCGMWYGIEFLPSHRNTKFQNFYNNSARCSILSL